VEREDDLHGRESYIDEGGYLLNVVVFVIVVQNTYIY